MYTDRFKARVRTLYDPNNKALDNMLEGGSESLGKILLDGSTEYSITPEQIAEASSYELQGIQAKAKTIVLRKMLWKDWLNDAEGVTVHLSPEEIDVKEAGILQHIANTRNHVEQESWHPNEDQ